MAKTLFQHEAFAATQQIGALVAHMLPAVDEIRARWRELVGSAADAPLHELIAAYSSAGRHYHDLAHIAALLRLTAEHADRLADRAAVDLAIFYHDAVYDAKRSDNEAKSAALARAQLPAQGVRLTLVATDAARWPHRRLNSGPEPRTVQE